MTIQWGFLRLPICDGKGIENARDNLGGEGYGIGVLPAVGVSVVDVCSEGSFSMIIGLRSFDSWYSASELSTSDASCST